MVVPMINLWSSQQTTSEVIADKYPGILFPMQVNGSSNCAQKFLFHPKYFKLDPLLNLCDKESCLYFFTASRMLVFWTQMTSCKTMVFSVTAGYYDIVNSYVINQKFLWILHICWHKKFTFHNVLLFFQLLVFGNENNCDFCTQIFKVAVLTWSNETN